MAEYIDKVKLKQAMYQKAFIDDSDLTKWDGGCWIRYKLFENVLEKTEVADVMTRDEGIRLGAELAAMHGSDATSQDLEKSYWRGFEDAMQKRDVQPVKHGRWIERDCHFDVECKCSMCGYKDFIPTKHDRYWFNRNYCPNCGTKMDGET